MDKTARDRNNYDDDELFSYHYIMHNNRVEQSQIHFIRSVGSHPELLTKK